jgi:hypothetical protein
MITSGNAVGPTPAIASNTNPPREEPEEWEAKITEAPWRLVGLNRSGVWNSQGEERLVSTNEELQKQLKLLKKVR